MQILVNAMFFQREFRINVGLHRRSWKLCHRTKEMAKAPEREKKTIVVTSQTFPTSPVMILHIQIISIHLNPWQTIITHDKA